MSEVEQTLRINARPETVWKFWTDPKRLCEWWGVSAAADAAPGGAFRVEMASGLAMLGQYVELVPHERLVFTFGYEPGEHAPPIAPGASTVEVTLVEDAGDTVLTLRHTGIPNELASSHNDGWTRHLPLLAAAVVSCTA